MKVIEYYSLPENERKHWLDEMEKSDWDVAGYLHWLIKENKLAEACGENSKVILLADGDKLASFCTYVLFDEIEDENMKPWAGFVYTFPEYRGKRCAGLVLDAASEFAKNDGYNALYVSSEEKGLYEKYGFTFVKIMRSVHDYDTGVFVKRW